MGFFKGATAWEGYIGPFWYRLPFWCYLRCRVWPTVGIDRGDDT